MKSQWTELLEAARQMVYFGETDLTRLREAVNEVDELQRSSPPDDTMCVNCGEYEAECLCGGLTAEV